MYLVPPSLFCLKLIFKGGKERILLPQTLPSPLFPVWYSSPLDTLPHKLDILHSFYGIVTISWLVSLNYNVHIFYYAWYGSPELDTQWFHWNHKYLGKNTWKLKDYNFNHFGFTREKKIYELFSPKNLEKGQTSNMNKLFLCKVSDL